MGAGSAVALALSVLAAPPTARMMFKCAADLILILERSFRYKGKYVSTKQIEDAAIYYTTTTFTTFSGKEKLLQAHVHAEIDKLIPLTKVGAGIRFARLRQGFEEIVYKNRFEKPDSEQRSEISSPSVPELYSKEIAELGNTSVMAELEGDSRMVAELPAEVNLTSRNSRSNTQQQNRIQTEMRVGGTTTTSDTPSWIHTPDSVSGRSSERGLSEDEFWANTTLGSPVSPEDDRGTPVANDLLQKRSNGSVFSRMMGGRKLSSKFGLSKTKSG